MDTTDGKAYIAQVLWSLLPENQLNPWIPLTQGSVLFLLSGCLKEKAWEAGIPIDVSRHIYPHGVTATLSG